MKERNTGYCFSPQRLLLLKLWLERNGIKLYPLLPRPPRAAPSSVSVSVSVKERR